MALSRRVRRTLPWSVLATAAAAAIGVLAGTGVLRPHHNSSSPARIVSATPTLTPSPNETPLPSPSPTSTAARSAQATAATSPTGPTKTPAPADLDLHSVAWKNVALPGDTCFSDAPIQLNNGQAILAGTPHDRSVTLAQLWDPLNTSYGKLGDAATDDAAVTVDCSYANGTAASNLKASVVVFSGAGGTLHVLGTLSPTVQLPGMHVTLLSDPVVTDGRITITETFYGPHDPDAAGSGRANAVYTWTGSGFTSHTTITQQPATAPPTVGG